MVYNNTFSLGRTTKQSRRLAKHHMELKKVVIHGHRQECVTRVLIVYDAAVILQQITSGNFETTYNNHALVAEKDRYVKLVVKIPMVENGCGSGFNKERYRLPT